MNLPHAMQQAVDVATAQLKAGFDLQIEAVYEASFSARVRQVLSEDGVPVLVQGRSHGPEGSLDPGWGFYVDTAFVKSMIGCSLKRGAIGMEPNASIPIDAEVNSVGLTDGACTARNLADLIRLSGPPTFNSSPFQNLRFEKLMSAVIDMAEGKARKLGIEPFSKSESGRPLPDSWTLVSHVGTSPDHVRWLIAHGELAGSRQMDVLDLGIDLGDSTRRNLPLAADRILSAIPVRGSISSYLRTPDFVFAQGHKGAEWLSHHLNNPSPWVAEHLLPRIRMRQMRQIAFANSTTCNSMEERMAIAARVINTMDLADLAIPNKVTAVVNTPHESKRAQCRI